ncbi:hypothetical protein Tthe_2325 [Thermoanaerobacterium thermosaccharolyticum DSM 571]|uniref:Uncharacterized protein n=1 Tax=Thermoanaerobacterium thermosaccharolyticum (strain ATCC 7956 / DSM 571 / NCIMB 9385 / NCA 3814 / NCTC 13789 / WDCM 00135 / 2032) TaxID=580327 RepID=D9TS73_THETC|nr:hypothetical protein [Thermoanaerobacterium thermosaccharolyticum]ADL69796.1 hypothetical protein Tthe_2325 [Thermoanaerobacterium thermosaccharolyticum DSM 571]
MDLDKLDRIIKNDEDWDKFIELLNTINEDYLKSIGKYNLFRISFYTWYVMSEWGRLSPKLEKCLDQAEHILIDAFKIATEKYSNDEDYLWFYGYLISVFPEHFLSIYSDYLKAENAGKQMLNVASRRQYPLAIIFNEKFLEKDILEKGKKDLENMFNESTEVYDYFIRMIELIESEDKK